MKCSKSEEKIFKIFGYTLSQVIVGLVLISFFILITGDFGIFILLAIGLYIFFKQNTARGLNTIRAGMFLMYLSDGYNIESANDAVMYFNYKTMNTEVANKVKFLCMERYGESQLSMIRDAKSKGFIG